MPADPTAALAAALHRDFGGTCVDWYHCDGPESHAEEAQRTLAHLAASGWVLRRVAEAARIDPELVERLIATCSVVLADGREAVPVEDIRRELGGS